MGVAGTSGVKESDLRGVAQARDYLLGAPNFFSNVVFPVWSFLFCRNRILKMSEREVEQILALKRSQSHET
jgi:hypothetical protein